MVPFKGQQLVSGVEVVEEVAARPGPVHLKEENGSQGAFAVAAMEPLGRVPYGPDDIGYVVVTCLSQGHGLLYLIPEHGLD